MKDFFEDHLDLIVIIILCVVVSVSIFFGYRYDKKHYVTEESLMIIEINSLEDHEYYTYTTDSKGICHKHEHHDYYIHFDDQKIEVSKSVYKDSYIGKRIVINVITKYSRDNDEVISKKYVYQN